MGLGDVIAAKIYAVDFNNDGHTDLVTLPDFYSQAEFHKFIPSKKIWEKTPSPFQDRQAIRAHFLAFADFDKDGIKDVIFATFNQKTEMSPSPLLLFQGYLQQGQYKLKRVSRTFPPHTDPISSLALLDYDLDGYLDVYVGNWYDSRRPPPRPIPDRLYKGKAFSFEEKTHLLEGELEYRSSHESYLNARPTSGISVCDINRDGYPDILTANTSGFGNRLWLSQGASSGFKDIGESSGYAFDQDGAFSRRGGGNSTFSKCADYNNDGIMDIAVGEIVMSYESKQRDISGILTGFSANPHLKFIRKNYSRDDGSQLNHRGDRRGVWLDYNNDSLIDLLIDNSGFPPHSRLTLFKQESDHGFLEQSKELGIDILNPSSSISIDFDNDGNIDIITGQTSTRNQDMRKRIYAFKNTQSIQGNVYRFHLRGRQANSEGIGGTVVFRSDKQFYQQAIDNLYGPFPGQNEEGVRFALPPEEKFEYVEVHWPLIRKSFPVVKRYSIRLTSARKNHVYTLCDTGQYYRGKRNSCPR